MKLYSTREINKIAYKKTHSTNISNEINSHYAQEIKNARFGSFVSGLA